MSNPHSFLHIKIIKNSWTENLQRLYLFWGRVYTKIGVANISWSNNVRCNQLNHMWHNHWDKYSILCINTTQKMKFSTKDFSSKCDQIRRKLRIWSNLMEKSLMENFIFRAVWQANCFNSFWKIKNRQMTLSVCLDKGLLICLRIKDEQILLHLLIWSL